VELGEEHHCRQGQPCSQTAFCQHDRQHVNFSPSLIAAKPRIFAQLHPEPEEETCMSLLGVDG
jgi:hypothetical protein